MNYQIINSVPSQELGIGRDRAPWEDGIDDVNGGHELSPRSVTYNEDNKEPLDPVINSFPQGLEALDMSLHRIKDRHVSLIVQRCPKLHTLDINATYFTQRSIHTIKDNLCETLVRLSLSSYWVYSFVELHDCCFLNIEGILKSAQSYSIAEIIFSSHVSYVFPNLVQIQFL